MTTRSQNIAKVNKVFDSLLNHCEDDKFEGWDPFDGLNSRIFNATPLTRSRFARLAWIQLFKRLPINFRAIALIPKTSNAVTAGLAARTYAILGKEKETQEQVKSLLDLRSPVKDWGSGAWGYPFVWQARAFHVPAEMPNVVATAFSCRCIYDTGGDITPIIEAAELVEKHLIRKSKDGRTYIGYIPTSNAMVHNANLWGAYILILAGKLAGISRYMDIANDAISYSINAQNEDGSWSYGEASHHQFIDNFHTGYNLEAIYQSSQIAGHNNYDAVLNKGLEYYQNNLFLEDGTPKYYSNSVYPIDCNAVAQSIVTFLTVLPTKERVELAEKILLWSIDNLWIDKKNIFAYQKRSWGNINISYMRWTQIWMLYTMALWLDKNSNPNKKGNI